MYGSLHLQFVCRSKLHMAGNACNNKNNNKKKKNSREFSVSIRCDNTAHGWGNQPPANPAPWVVCLEERHLAKGHLQKIRLNLLTPKCPV